MREGKPSDREARSSLSILYKRALKRSLPTAVAAIKMRDGSRQLQNPRFQLLVTAVKHVLLAEMEIGACSRRYNI